jgi:SHS2 domain-containing protein
MGFRLLPHTADLRAVLEAADRPELYRVAAELVCFILVGSSPVAAVERREIALEAVDEPERLFRFVRELLFLYDVEAFLPAAVSFGDPLTVRGEVFDPARHASEHQVKAVTRHGYVFRQGPFGYHVELVFDL